MRFAAALLAATMACAPGADSDLQPWVASLDLTPGTYVPFCLVPDPSTRKLHVDLGMVRTVTVGEGPGVP